MAKTWVKQPREIKDYGIVSADYFEGIDDEWESVVIEVDKVTVPPLEIGPAPHAEYDLIGDPKQTVKIWIGGGQDRQKYKVTALMTSRAGRIEEEEFYIKIKET